jgi:hypothetical protein
MIDSTRTAHGSQRREAPGRTSAGIGRAAKALVLAASVETGITVGHFVYGAYIYNDPGRLHIVVPALGILAAAAAMAALFVWRPGRLGFAALALVIAVPYLAVFGLFHGAYSHLLKDLFFVAGAPDDTLEWLFMSPDYVHPDDILFEATGLLGLVAAAVVGYWLVRLFRVWRRQPIAAGVCSTRRHGNPRGLTDR